jgi:hypothetical protein
MSELGLGATISPDKIVVRNGEPISASVDGETVILGLEAEAYFGLGEIGSVIWEMIATPRRVSDICARLGNDYDVSPEICERDTLAFLSRLLADKLIRIVDEGASPS